MKPGGFSLLEAIVALVLMASTGLALLNWINTHFISLRRVQQVQQRDDATRNALAFMETVNPLETPRGEEKLGIYRLKWAATVVKPPKDGVTSIGGLSLFEIGLYDTQIEIYLENTLLTRFTLRQVGFKQVRKYDYSI